MKKIPSILLVTVLLMSLFLPVMASSGASTAKSALEIVNEVRVSAGVAPLSWDDTLAEAAKERAEELAVKYTKDHTRPDGSKYYTVSLLVWGENIAYGYKTAEQVMDAFIKSKGHRENILSSSYTTIGIACFETSDSVYWVQEFGNGKSNARWTGNTESSVTVGGTSGSLVGKNGKIDAGSLVAELKKSMADVIGHTASVRVKNATAISPDALHAASTAAEAANKTVRINADTMTSDGKAIQGRLVVIPAKRTKDLSLGVYTDAATTDPLKAQLQERYSNEMVVISLSHKGSLGASLKVFAKADLSKLDAKNLRFWNDDGKSLTEIREPQYTVDKNGFLKFYTSIGGTIVVTDTDIVGK